MSEKKAKKDDFEGLFTEIGDSVSKLESEELSMSQSIDLYGQVNKKIQKAQKMLEEMEGKIENIDK